MSSRKSSNFSPKANYQESIRNNRIPYAFQLVKCNVCQIELTQKDLPKHGDVCKSFVESVLDLEKSIEYKNIVCDRRDLFESSFLCNGCTLFTSSISIINKGL